ncbi:MAG: NFACT RNA binding domain-containing protein [Ignavibacteriales bacterium]|nr:NFACT RNA binding domain-containing protein [Ignavibacteriales bacterium]
MLSHLYTFRHLVLLLSASMEGKTIAAIYSQEKNQLCLVFDEDDPSTLVVSCEASFNYVVSRHGTGRTKRNSIDLFPHLPGKTIRKIGCKDFDRIIEIDLETGQRLEILMFGTKANALLYTGSTLEDAFLRKKEIVAGEELVAYKEPAASSASDIASWIERFRSFAVDMPLHRALRNVLPDFGTTLTTEALFRCGMPGMDPVGRLIDRDLERLFHAVQNILSMLQPSPARLQPCIYYDEENTPVCFSLLPLHSMEQYRLEIYPDVNEGIQRFVSRKLRSASFLKEQDSILSRLQKEEKKIEHALSRVTKDLEESSRSDEYERSGKILMAQLPLLSKGMKSFEYQGEKIAMEPAMTPVQNAERYFGKAKKSKAARDEQRARTSELQNELMVLRMLAEEAAELQTPEAIARFQDSREKYLARLGITPPGSTKELPPFRIFTVDGGFQVLAGKSSENNDLLTLKYAKPDDLWFHARGSSGSHVVLKIGSAKGDPSKRAIHQAASIAAYYSKMKNASMIPVAMTAKKFVRKPKGVPAGTVVIEREKVLFVEAELPSDS